MRKRKKEKKAKKARKREKKRRKREKRRRKAEEEDERRAREDAAALDEADTDQLEAFRAAVQGPKLSRPGSRAEPRQQQASALGLATAAERADALGLPKGLIRTSQASESVSEGASRQLFGYSGASNPAQAARLKRERSAQSAMETARAVLAKRAKEDTTCARHSSSLASRFGR